MSDALYMSFGATHKHVPVEGPARPASAPCDNLGLTVVGRRFKPKGEFEIIQRAISLAVT